MTLSAEPSTLRTRGGATRVAIYVELGFRSGVQRVWSGARQVEQDGKTWYPTAPIGRISDLEERATLAALPFTLQLVAFAADFAQAMPEYLAFRDAVRAARDTPVLGGGVAIYWMEYGMNDALPMRGSLVLKKRGIMSRITRQESVEAVAINLHCEDRLAARRRPSNWRLTPADQEARYPGDKALEFAPGLGAGDGRLVTWKRNT